MTPYIAIFITMLMIIKATEINQPSLEITQITNNNGFVISRSEEIKIVKSYTKVLHIVDINRYAEVYKIIETNIKNLNLHKNDILYTPIQNELEELSHNIGLLMPYSPKRTKRGLINIIGKIEKYLIGTMDSEDSEEIYKHLEDLEEKVTITTNELNKQVIVNNNLIKNLDTIEKHINKQSQEIMKYTYKLGNDTNKMIFMERRLELTFQTHTFVQTLNRNIEKFLDIILLSRLNILAHDVLTNNEILKFNITTNILPYQKTNVIISKNILAFCLSIPQFTPEKYYKALIIPIPDLNKEELDIETTEILLKNKTIYELPNQITKESQLIKHKNYCIQNILNNTHNCKFKINKLESIEQINNIIILKNLNNTIMRHNCNENNTQVLTGNSILHFHICKIKIQNIEYINEQDTIIHTLIIPTTNITENHLINNLTLEHLTLEHINNREIIENIAYTQKSSVITGSTLTIIIIILIMFLFCKHYTGKPTIKIRTTQNIADPFK